MTGSEFIHWLDGLLEANSKLTKDQTAKVKSRLDDVLRHGEPSEGRPLRPPAVRDWVTDGSGAPRHDADPFAEDQGGDGRATSLG